MNEMTEYQATYEFTNVYTKCKHSFLLPEDLEELGKLLQKIDRLIYFNLDNPDPRQDSRAKTLENFKKVCEEKIRIVQESNHPPNGEEATRQILCYV